MAKAFYVPNLSARLWLPIVLLLFVACGIAIDVQAQTTDPTYAKTRRLQHRKTRRTSEKLQEYVQEVPEKKTNYQGQKTKTTKVKLPSPDKKVAREDERAEYSGKIPYKHIENRKLDRKYDAQDRANFTGDLRVTYQQIKDRKISNSRRTSAYAGNILAGKLRRFRRDNIDKGREMADYSGNIRYVNIPKVRQRKAAQLASFKGATPIRVRQRPKGALVSTYKGIPNRNRYAANYRPTRFKTGRRVKESELANYQKERKTKLRYSSRETEMWRTGGNTTPRTERKLPTKSEQRANRKAEAERMRQEQSQPEPKPKPEGGDN